MWSTSTVKLTSGIPNDQINLFLGDSLIGSRHQFPYEFDLNTNVIADGDYTLRAISAHLPTAEVKISVRNKLLVTKVDNNHLPAGTRGFLFLSDKEGTTYSSVEFKNGDDINLSKEDFQFENFTLSEVYVKGTRTLSIYSFQEVPRGEWTLLKANETPAIINTIAVDFTDISSAYYYVSSSGDAEFLYGKSSLNLNINKSPTKLFIREFNNPINHYKIADNLNAEGRQVISLFDITTPLSVEKIKLKDGTNKRGTIRLYGFPAEGNTKEYYTLGNFFSKNGEIAIEYPGNAFPVYGSASFYKDDNITINSFQMGKKSELLPLTVEVDFKSSASLTATIATFGEIDAFAATWAYFNEKSNASAYWTMIGPPGRSQVIKLPELPMQVRMAAQDVSIDELQFSNTLEVTDYGIAKDYPTYLRYISKNSLSGPYAFGESWKEQLFIKSGNTHGRTNGQSVQSLSERLFSR